MFKAVFEKPAKDKMEVNLTDQRSPPNQQQADYAKWIEELRRHDAERAHDKLDNFFDKSNEAAVKTSELAMRMALLINGGAAISLLTFIGALPKEQRKPLADTLIWFSSGVFASVLAIVFAYFTHYFMAGIAGTKLRGWEHPFVRPGQTTRRYTILANVFHVAAAISEFVSLLLFICGMFAVRAALTHL